MAESKIKLWLKKWGLRGMVLFTASSAALPSNAGVRIIKNTDKIEKSVTPEFTNNQLSEKYLGKECFFTC